MSRRALLTRRPGGGGGRGAQAAVSAPASLPAPSTFLSDILVWIDADAGNVSVIGGEVASFANRGTLGGTIAQTAGNRAAWLASDSRFNNKPSFASHAPPGATSYPLPALGAPAAAECFVVGVRTANPSLTAETGFQRTGSDAALGTNTGHVPYTDGVVYGEFCTTARKVCGTPTANLSAPWLIDMWSAPNDWGMRINRAGFYSTPTNTVGYDATPGILLDVDSSSALPYSFVGSWAVYILCGSKQSSAQRAQLEAWASATYGVAPLPLPTSVSTVGLWMSEYRFDAASANTWTDIVNGIVFGNATPGTRPTLGTDGTNFNGRPVLRFDGASKFLSTGVLGSPLWTAGAKPYAYVVMRRVSVPGVYALYWIAGNTGGGGGAWGISLAANGAAGTHTRGTAGADAGSGITDLLPHTYAHGFNAANIEVSVDGVFKAATGSAAAVAQSLLTVGALQDGALAPGGFGDMQLAALWILSTKPSVAEDAAIVAALRARYGTP